MIISFILTSVREKPHLILGRNAYDSPLVAYWCRFSCDLLPAKFLHFELLSINASVGIYILNDFDLQLLVSTYYSDHKLRNGLMFAMCSEILFSFALASASPSPTVAANLLPFLLAVLAIVNGIFVPHPQMPNPWRDFVYWANPVVSSTLVSLRSIWN